MSLVWFSNWFNWKLCYTSIPEKPGTLRRNYEVYNKFCEQDKLKHVELIQRIINERRQQQQGCFSSGSVKHHCHHMADHFSHGIPNGFDSREYTSGLSLLLLIKYNYSITIIISHSEVTFIFKKDIFFGHKDRVV